MSNVQGAMSNKLKTEEHVVAFIDVLGATHMINTDADASLNKIHSAYVKAKKLFDAWFLSKGLMNELISITIFSDNIIIAGKVTDVQVFKSVYSAVHIMAALFQWLLMVDGILLRGGITHGSFYKDDIMVWGAALVKSHELESKTAIYPRIVVDPDTIERIGDPFSEENTKFIRLKKDFDGMFFVDYVDYIKPNAQGVNKALLLREIDRNMKEISENANNTKLLQKFYWHANYIESKLADYKVD